MADASLDGVVDAPRHFQCSTCKRAFTRADHLTRHVRAHTSSKPYVCITCSKGFSRVDLLKRHATGCADEGPNKRQRKKTVRASRVIQACESCALNHLRCEHEKPCSRCRSRNIECRIPSAKTFPAVPTDIDAVQQQSTQDDYVPEYYLEDDQNTSQIAIVDDNGVEAHGHMMILPFETCPSGIPTPRGIMDLSFDWDLDLTDLDIGFLDQYNQQAPFIVDTPSTPDACGSQGMLQQTVSEADDSVSVRHEAFKRSVWRFLPQKNRDFGAAEQPNLAFGDAEMQNSHHQSHLTARRAIHERLDRGTRDRLLALVLGTCNPTNIGRIASAFPTVELLDGLLQYSLTSPSLDTKTWFHLPTFSPSKLLPPLLAGMIAAGATSTPDIPLRKLGFALHEASRVGNAKAFEDDNTSIRDLQHLQSLMVSLEIGMWSGISRKMEIAESFLQPLVTMLRRGGRFRRSTWDDIVPHHNDDDNALESKWNAWILQEQYLRLVYRVFQHDRQSSMALVKPPLISYAELQIPLPHADVLWRTDSAQAWRAAHLSCLESQPQTGTPKETSVGCFLDIHSLRCPDSASLAYLYMLWGMVWDHKQMVAVAERLHGSQTSSLVLHSRHLELTKYIEDFRLINAAANCGVTILIELMLMHLNASLDDLQLFAGIEGHEEAYRVHPSLQLWVKLPSARQALWHAGQILRAAQQLPKELLRNFNAIAVYHAGLILWGYGCLGADLENMANMPSLVCLDSDDNVEIRRFITLGRGTPALKSQESRSPAIPIGDIGRVMETLIRLLKVNTEGVEGSSPPLVENLVQLMHGLHTASKDKTA